MFLYSDRNLISWYYTGVDFFKPKLFSFYFKSHETERTQWDHPEMVSLMEEIGKQVFGLLIIRIF